MWNYIKGLLRIGIPFDVAWMGIVTLFSDAMVIWPISVLITGSDSRVAAVILILLMGPIAAALNWVLINYCKQNMSPVPYFGEHFDKDTVFKLLAEDKFTPYTTKDGYVCKSLKISESGRWLKIAGRYYPIPFIKGLNKLGDSFELINGQVVTIRGIRSYDRLIKHALEELFPPVMARVNISEYDDIPSNSAEAFKRVWDGDMKELAQADWFEVRYRWEKVFSEMLDEDDSAPERQEALEEITEEHLVYKRMFRSILGDDEIAAIAGAVKAGEIERPNAMFDITNYGDDYCICNGIKVLEAVGYPDSRPWAGFLFDCLKDVEKSYCNDAIAVLKKGYPKQELVDRIDADIMKAHEANDLRWAAGLIALAKAIDHEIVLETEKIEEKAPEEGLTITG